MKPLVLIVEDQEALVTMLRYNLETSGFRVNTAGDGEEALVAATEEVPDLILLDWMLPLMSGIEVCRQLRSKPDTRRVPIIMLTARGEVTDRIVGLELGADDYLPKPFEPRELVARIQNVLRRTGGRADGDGTLNFTGLEINPERRTAMLDGDELELTTMEFQLLALLARNPGKVFSRDDILNGLRGIDAQLFSRSVDILVSRLRHKLHDTAKQPRFIKTVWGTGYTFVGEESQS